MGMNNGSSCWHKYRQTTFISIFILFAASSTSLFMAQGRAMSNVIEVSQNKVRVIGSRPPRCESRCSNCGHCEAVQVPIVPTFHHHHEAAIVAFSSRGDALSNYKPMSWKCKCGDYFFNP
ncbi:EPIDERMAL PATTERNING FACTOR-like protein 2 [Arachis stenosperma]|uniref:EPIDERMAL PATTERNING FACTOR-like protein 2 n=1 Tax=Arachis stenosperma TaxID=217475 RepID=UPI0025ACE918|nr:EPIDERMAL PATTERNING FACTOR-like protein 2 [Arachis stenosperma]